jgi:AraC-like DNA-binding protein
VARPRIEPPIANVLVPAALRWAGRDDDDTGSLPYSRIVEILEDLARDRACPELGLRLARELTERYAYGELAARASATIGDAIDRAARFLPLSVPGHVARVERDREVRVHITPPPRKKASRVLSEYAVMWAVEQTGANAIRAWFTHARPRDLGPIHLALRTDELEFGAIDDGFSVSLDEADRTLTSADPRLAALMDDLASQQLPKDVRSYGDLVARKIDALLPTADIEAVAAALRASPRTVQRRLEDEGTRFSEVLDRARAERAKQLLHTTMPLAEIAARIGFSELSPFTRAFKRWTGTTPGAYRRR